MAAVMRKMKEGLVIRGRKALFLFLNVDGG
jgi:hypothetical protein